jgi:hypothetical protein
MKKAAEPLSGGPAEKAGVQEAVEGVRTSLCPAVWRHGHHGRVPYLLGKEEGSAKGTAGQLSRGNPLENPETVDPPQGEAGVSSSLSQNSTDVLHEIQNRQGQEGLGNLSNLFFLAPEKEEVRLILI